MLTFSNISRFSNTLLVTLLIITVAWTIPGQLFADDESFVIGRMTGTYQRLPGYFYNNPNLLSRGIYEIEFTGFRLLRVPDGKRHFIRPIHEGYFYQDLPKGEYTLTRKRNDRPNFKESKSIDIMKFKIRPWKRTALR